MEGKTMVLSVVIVTLFMAQILVEAQEPKVCCPRENARWFYDTCRESTSWVTCLPMSGCIAVATGDICPPNYPYDMLKKPGQGDAVNEYCKLGCGFSACGALITLQNSGNQSKLRKLTNHYANEIVNGAVEQCTKACATICNKGSLAAVQNA